METQFIDAPTGQGNSSELADYTAPERATPYDVTDDVFGIKTLFVNVFFVGEPGQGIQWTLINALFCGYADAIRQRAQQLYGPTNPPQAIVLTHGHADILVAYAVCLNSGATYPFTRTAERPYLTGISSYPPPDPAIGGGGMALMSWVLPIGPEDFGDVLTVVNENDRIPELPDWQVVHTPGHSPGHISLFRASDRTLLAGDAFVTTNQNSLSSIINQTEEVHGPPAYFTCDWVAAEQSVKRLALFNPLKAGTGHGVSMQGLDLQLALGRLVSDFRERSIPSEGRYVKEAAVTDENGIVSMPTPTSFHVARAIGIGLAIGLVFGLLRPRRR